MKFRKSIAAAAFALVAFAGSIASASTFTFDPGSSNIQLMRTFDLCWGCGVSTEFLAAPSWDPDPGVDTKRVDDFVRWTVGYGWGGELYDITANLAFSSPNSETGSATGFGGVGTIAGKLSGGFVSWDGPGEVTFDDGSTLKFTMDNFLIGGLGQSVVSGVTFETTTPVPLPAAGWMLIAGLGGLVAMKRRSKAA